MNFTGKKSITHSNLMNLSSRNKYVNSEKVLMLLFHKPCQQFQNDNLRVKKNVIKQQM